MGRGSGTHNPYTPDSGIRPPMLTGRDAELAQLRSVVQELTAGGTEKHILVTGLRGVGKTVLLNEFEEMCAEAGWLAETREVGRTTHLGPLVGRQARKTLLHMSTKARVKDRLNRALGTLKSFEVTLPGDVSFKVEADAVAGAADSGDLAEDLRDVLLAVGEAADEAGLGFALILDEVQNLSRDDYEVLIMALHRAKQKRLPVAFVGAGLPLVPALTAEAKSYAERMFRYPSIGALSEEAARDALALPAEQQGVSWESSAVAVVLKESEGYPYFIQEYGRYAWAQNSVKRITRHDVEHAKPLAQADLDESFYEQRIGRLTDAERQYVGAMAALGDGPQRTAEVAKRLRRAHKAVSYIRDDLKNRAIIYAPRRGEVDFTVPHCADFIRRHHPLDTPAR